jgi:hypothetical protein
VDHRYDYGDLIWYTGDGGKKPGIVADPRDGFELEIVHSYTTATTAHVTQLESRDDG